jgi:hypothetical protein
LKLGSMLEDVPIVAYITVPDASRGFPMLYCNAETESATGFARFALIAKPNRFFTHTLESEAEEAEALRIALLHSEPRTSQLTAVYSDGSLNPVLIRSKPLYDHMGRHLFTLSVQTKVNEDLVFDIVSAVFTTVPRIISVNGLI